MIVPVKDVITELIKMGTMATINQNIPSAVAISAAKKFGFNAVVKEAGEEVTVEQEEDKPEMMTPRPPVVTVLGHVDHGKTSLLDKIRQANVAGGEAGGITQKIGAYTVEQNDRKITFIDTPGHEAFTAMRARGAKVTDVAVLVVAADDGVMPQTREAIAHVKAAGVPIVVAINKMDKPDAQPDRVKQQLMEQGLQPVDWGGTIEMVPVSAKTGDGIAHLLDTVLLEADIRDLKANRTRRATGVVIESALDRGRGAVATVLVQNGTLRVGDIIVVGGTFGKVRALIDDQGKQVKKAGPSIPVEIMGLSDVPSAGDSVAVVSDERVAREAAEKRATRRRDVRISAGGSQRVSLETFMSMPAEGKKALNLIIKADGQGSLEALRARMESLSDDNVDIRVIHGGVGAISPNDVNLASASNAVLIGFNIRPDETARRLAENEGVDLRFYQVIYEVEEDLKKAMRGMLAPSPARGHARDAPRFARSSRSRRSERSSAATSPAARFRVTQRLASSAIRRSSSTAKSSRCGASRTTFAKSPKASSAASKSRSSKTSKRVTSSKPTRSSTSPRSWCTHEGSTHGQNRSRDPAHSRYADRPGVAGSTLGVRDGHARRSQRRSAALQGARVGHRRPASGATIARRPAPRKRVSCAANSDARSICGIRPS